MNQEHSVVIDGISKTYQLSNGKLITALEDVSLKVNRGEKWGVIGRNGSGKSTLLHILASIIKPSSGEVEIYGSLGQILEVGGNFIPDLSGRENIMLFLKLKGRSKQEVLEQIDNIIEFAAIGAFIEEPVKTYSSGMFLRLAFSVILQLKSEILLVDEVFNAGDALFREKLKTYFKESLELNTTMFLASHNPEEILEFCTHCLWLDKGRIIKKGKVNDVLQSYYYEMAKENSLNTNLAQSIDPNIKESLLRKIENFENDYFTLVLFTSETPIGFNSLTYESGILFKIKLKLKGVGDRLYPQIIIYDYQQKPVLTFFPNPQSELSKIAKKLANYKGLVEYVCFLPPQMLTYGQFYADLRFGKNIDINSEFNEEACKINKKIFFQIERSSSKEYIGRTESIFIRPEVKWEYTLS